jgi:arginase
MHQQNPLIHIYGVPIDLGQKRRGVDMGASAVRYAGLQPTLERLGCRVHDGGNITVPIPEQIADQIDNDPSDGRAHHVPAISQMAYAVYEQMLRANAADETVIFLGGDHSISIGTVAGALCRAEQVGVLWVDAHGDFNTPMTTPSGNVHGMVVAALMGRCPPELTIGDCRLRPEQIVMIATRDLDAEERAALRDSGIRVFTMRDLDERGMAAVAADALKTLGAVESLHVSLDLDSLDPSVAPGVGTAVPGGLSYREAHLLMEILADDGRVRSLDLVEINPLLDNGNHTAELAVELAAGLFGKRIL